MSRKFHLQPLLDLAGYKSDSRGSELTQLRARMSVAQEKLTQLEQYRSDYSDALTEKMCTGMDAGHLREYRVFLASLDTAIAQQNEEVGRCLLAWEAARVKWEEARRELKAYDVLADRHQAAEAKREARVEQKEHDDLTATRPGIRSDPNPRN